MKKSPRTPGNIIVIGATSGIGRYLARHYASQGWKVGACGRRTHELEELAAEFPGQVTTCALDVTEPDCTERLQSLAASMGGVDTVVYSAGCGWNNPDLDLDKDMHTVRVNVGGFTRVADTVMHWFRDHRPATRPTGRFVAVTSIAGTRGLGVSASYSATKRYCFVYMEALEQLAHQQHIPLAFTDIQPGFIHTALLDTATRRYPMLMSLEYAGPRIVRAIDRGRHRAVIDWRWCILTAMWRRIPRWIWRKVKLDF